MKLTSQQKLCVGLLALAVVALGADQMIGYDLPGPSSANGASEDLLIGSDRAGESGKTASSRQTARARVITVRTQLESLRPSAGSAVVQQPVDAFGMPKAILERIVPPKVVVDGNGQSRTVRGPERPNLRTDLKLTSILSFRDPSNTTAEPDARDAVAVIDGKACRLGDQFEGWIIREITPRAVLLEEQGDWADDGGARLLRLELRDRDGQSRS